MGAFESGFESTFTAYFANVNATLKPNKFGPFSLKWLSKCQADKMTLHKFVVVLFKKYDELGPMLTIKLFMAVICESYQ